MYSRIFSKPLQTALISFGALVALLSFAALYLNQSLLSQVFGYGKSQSLADACSLSDAKSLTDEVYFVSCGGFF